MALFVIALEAYIYLLYSPNKFQLVTLNSSQGVTFYEVYPMLKMQFLLDLLCITTLENIVLFFKLYKRFDNLI